MQIIKKTLIIVLFIISQLNNNGKAQEITWDNEYHFGYVDAITDVKTTTENNFISTCRSDTFGWGAFVRRSITFKVDTYGELQWKSIIGNDWTDSESYSLVVSDNDNSGYLVAGSVIGNGSIGNTDASILKIGNDGELIWQKQYDGLSYSDSFKSIISGNIDGYVAVGQTCPSSGCEENAKLFVVNLNENGDTIWTKLDGDYYQTETAIDRTIDNGYIVGGEGYFGATLAKIDDDGNGFTLIHENNPEATVNFIEILQYGNTITLNLKHRIDSKIINIDLFDITGNKIITQKESTDRDVIPLIFNNMNTGVYIIKVNYGTSCQVKKIFLI